MRIRKLLATIGVGISLTLAATACNTPPDDGDVGTTIPGDTTTILEETTTTILEETTTSG